MSKDKLASKTTSNYFQKCYFIIALLIVVFSSSFLTKLLPLSPIYLTTIVSFFATVYIAKNEKTLPNRRVLYYIVFVFSLYLMLNLLFTNSGVVKDVKDLYVLAFFTLYFIIVDISLTNVNRNELKKILFVYFSFNFLFLLFELIMRIKNAMSYEIPTWIIANPNYFFYMLKPNSIIFLDSNGTAVILLSVLSVLTYIIWDNPKYRCVKTWIFLPLFFILLIGTFSRASIMAYLVLLFYTVFVHKKPLVFRLIMFGCLLICIAFAFYWIANDFSFLSKFQIFAETFEYVKQLDVRTFLFGTGINTSTEHLSIYAHNFISIYLIEFGFIGLLLYVLMFGVIIMNTSKNHIYITIPYFIASLSFTPIIIPYIFCSYSLLYHLGRLEKVET